MEENLLMEAIKFMALGMSVVFSFLVVTVFSIKLQAVLINKFFPSSHKQTIAKSQSPIAVATTAQKVAAITAAIEYHNNLKG